MRRCSLSMVFIVLMLTSCTFSTHKIPSTSVVTIPSTVTPLPSPTRTPQATSTPIPVSYNYEDSITVDDRKEVELGVKSTYLFLNRSNLGTPDKLTVYVYSDIRKLTEISWPILSPEYNIPSKEKFLLEWKESGGTAAPGALFINTSYSSWLNGDPCFKVENTAHEIWHLMQRKWVKMPLKGADPVPPTGPEWITEGSAQIFAFKVAEVAKPGTCPYLRELKSRSEDSHPILLEKMEGSSEFNKAGNAFWSLAPTAVDYLIKQSPKRIEAIKDFYIGIGDGLKWEEAFLSAFGTSPQEFYVKFNAFLSKP